MINNRLPTEHPRAFSYCECVQQAARAAAALLALAVGIGSPCARAIQLTVQHQWNLYDTYGKEGHVGVRVFHDVDGDGELDVIFNLGRSADFVALKLDGTEIWRSIIEDINHKEGYYPVASVEQGLLFYGSRASNTLYAVNMNNGSLAWSRQLSERTSVNSFSLELTDVGVLAGHDGDMGRTVLYDFQGNILPGWPYIGPQHEQLLGAGDLDGDGQDDFLLNNNNGTLRVLRRDGSLMFERQSVHNHIDESMFADINRNPNNPNNLGLELLVAIDDDNSHSGEGDEIVLFNALGDEVARYATGSSGVNYVVGDIRPDLPGLEIFFGNEGSNTIGLLDHNLQPIFTSSLKKVASNLGVSLSNAGGQTALADLDGDGYLELLINSGEKSSSGILVFASRGDFSSPDFDAEDILLDAVFGKGWDFDPQSIFSHGDPRAKRFIDVTGDGRDDIIASSSGANSATGDRIMYLIGNSEAAPNYILGDVNQDGFVTPEDLAAFQMGWNSTGHSSLLERFMHGDFDLDGDTDLYDALVMKQALHSALQSQGQLASTAVPEPSTGILAVLSACLIALVSRRPFFQSFNRR